MDVFHRSDLEKRYLKYVLQPYRCEKCENSGNGDSMIERIFTADYIFALTRRNV